MKLWEGNDFSRMCLTACSQEAHITINYDALDLCTCTAPLFFKDMDMFKRVQLGPHCTGKAPSPQGACADLFNMKHVRLASR